jgi:5-bromo-4-chloroindolyl phosphate hydrolysis protein
MSKAKRYTTNKKTSLSLKGLLLYILPAPIMITAIFAFLNGEVSAIINNSIALVLFLITATLAKRGFKQEKDYHDSALTKAPSLPYKFTAALTLSIATFYTSYSCTDNSLFLSIILGIAALIGFYLYYGFDPREDKIGNLPVGVNADDLIEITQEARTKIHNLNNLKKELKNFESKEYLQSIIMETQEIITSVEENPEDLSKSRKFFKIYLSRTEDITQEFVENLHKNSIDEMMTDNYNRLLKSVQETIKAQKAKLDDDDILNLDVQIEALTKQINHEGV